MGEVFHCKRYLQYTAARVIWANFYW